MAITYFAAAPLDRHQKSMFAPTLDEMIGENHPVRILDELIDKIDLSCIESQYTTTRGHPPIPPIVLVKILLYALSRRIRSSRQIEYALGNHIDFMWLASCRGIDHSKLCTFRTKYAKELKTIFREIGKLAINIGLVRLNEITFDGTRVRANNNRFETLTAKGLEERLEELEKTLETWNQEVTANDQKDNSEPKAELPQELLDVNARKAAYQKALETVQKLDTQRQKTQQINPTKNPAQLPMTDPDSRVMPNKEGGYAPNFTPLIAVTVKGDFIAATEVIASVTEHTELVAIVDQVEENFGIRPEVVLGDGHQATGQNITAFENTETELISPLPVAKTPAKNPAVRPDPKVPVAETERPNLPLNPQTKKLDKACFQYDQETDTYDCPQGQALPFDKSKSKPTASGEPNHFKVYRCEACEGCPLHKMCVSDKSKGGRTVSRDEHTEQRERHAAKMATPEKKAQYQKRLHAGEVAFAYIKQVMGVRQFLLRGLAKVKTEWLWACTAYNMVKLMNHVAKLRARFAREIAAELE
jgi:transposase